MLFQKLLLKSFRVVFPLALSTFLLESVFINPSQAMNNENKSDENKSYTKKKRKKSDNKADKQSSKRSKTQTGTIKLYRVEGEDDSAVIADAFEENQVGTYKLIPIKEGETVEDVPIIATHIVEENQQPNDSALNKREYLHQEILNSSYFVDIDTLPTKTAATHSTSTVTTSTPTLDVRVRETFRAPVIPPVIPVLQGSIPQPHAIPRYLPSSLQGTGYPYTNGAHPFFVGGNNRAPTVNSAISTPLFVNQPSPGVNINFFSHSYPGAGNYGHPGMLPSFAPAAPPPAPVLQEQGRKNMDSIVVSARENIDHNTFAALCERYRDVRTTDQRLEAVKELYGRGITTTDISRILNWNDYGVDIALYQTGIKKMDLGNLQIRKMMKLCAAGWSTPKISNEPDINAGPETITKYLNRLTMSSECHKKGRRLEQIEIDKIEEAYNSGIGLEAIKKKFAGTPPYRIDRLCEVLNKLKLYDLTGSVSSN